MELPHRRAVVGNRRAAYRARNREGLASHHLAVGSEPPRPPRDRYPNDFYRGPREIVRGHSGEQPLPEGFHVHAVYREARHDLYRGKNALVAVDTSAATP